MSKAAGFFKSPLIQIALTTAVSIIVLAWFSKRILPQPIGYLPLAIPPFLATIHGALCSKNKDSKYCVTRYWVIAILLATALVILFNW